MVLLGKVIFLVVECSILTDMESKTELWCMIYHCKVNVQEVVYLNVLAICK